MKILKKINSSLLNQYKNNNYNTYKLQNNQLNNNANLAEINDLNIG